MNLKTLATFGLATCVALAAVSLASANEPPRPNLSEIIEDFRTARQELVQERRELAESLRDKTAEERRQAIAAYQIANADRIALHRALGEEIRELMASLQPRVERPDRPERPVGQVVADRPEIPTAVQTLMSEFRSARNVLLQERLDLLASMREATDEERAQALTDLREMNAETVAQQRETAEQIRNAMQELRENRRND